MDVRDGVQGLVQFRPDIAGCVEEADQELIVNYAVVRVQIIRRWQEALGRSYLAQLVGEGVLEACEAADFGWGIGAGGGSSAEFVYSAVRESEPCDILFRHAEALVAFVALGPPDIGDCVLLFGAAITHAAVCYD